MKQITEKVLSFLDRHHTALVIFALIFIVLSSVLYMGHSAETNISNTEAAGTVFADVGLIAAAGTAIYSYRKKGPAPVRILMAGYLAVGLIFGFIETDILIYMLIAFTGFELYNMYRSKHFPEKAEKKSFSDSMKNPAMTRMITLLCVFFGFIYMLLTLLYVVFMVFGEIAAAAIGAAVLMFIGFVMLMLEIRKVYYMFRSEKNSAMIVTE